MINVINAAKLYIQEFCVMWITLKQQQRDDAMGKIWNPVDQANWSRKHGIKGYRDIDPCRHLIKNDFWKVCGPLRSYTFSFAFGNFYFILKGFLLKKYLLFIFERDRERAGEGGREREKERERLWSSLQAPSCQHRAWHRVRTHELQD